jgi:hypothetical protein
MILNAGNSYSATCNWKPSTHSNVVIVVTIVPDSATYSTSYQQVSAFVSNKSGSR